MRRWPYLVLLTMTLAACATSSEVTPVVIDAARRAMACEPIEVSALRTMRYEVRGCGQTTYWACSAGSRSRSEETVCCSPVESKEKVLKTFALVRPAEQVCEAVGADVPFLSQ